MTLHETPDLRAALALVDEHDTWQALRAALEERHLAARIGAGGLEQVLAAWQARAAWRLTDGQLAQEVAHWAGGGSYADHLHGFNAVAPTVLVAEAERRGWFVRRLGPKALINPPDGKPLAVPLTTL